MQLYRNPEYKKVSGGSDDAKGSTDAEGKKKSSTRKYVCPKCGISIRATKEIRIACIDCGNIQMEPAVEIEKSK